MADNLDEGQAALDAAFSLDRDRGADSAAPETSEKIPAPDKADASQEVKAEDKPEGDSRDPFKEYRDPDTKRLVPLKEVQTERTKRQEESRLRGEAEQRAARAEAERDEARRYAEQFYRQQPQQQQQPPQAPPDPYTDPEGFHAHTVQQARTASVNERLNISQMMAEEKFGEDVVGKAFQAAQRAGVVQHFVNQRHPYAAVVSWHQRQEALGAIGDPTDFEQRTRANEREKVLAELKQGSASQQRFPGTLADASASGGQNSGSLSDQQMLDQLFAPDRHHKRR